MENNNSKQKIGYWFFGLLTGGAIAAPITAFLTKRVCDKKAEQEMAKTVDKAYSNGMNDMAEYIVANKQQTQQEEKQPEEDDGDPGDDQINDYNVTIDDKEATEEARERTEDHERYLDMIEKYRNPDTIPRKITAEEFENSSYLEKSFVNWYSKDNVFEEGLEVLPDPYDLFGVTNGGDLFANGDYRDDPNVVYIRNEKKLTDFEITRVYGSYSEKVGDEKSLGETDT